MACRNCTSLCSCRLRVRDTNTIDLTLSGSGSQAQPWVVEGVALIDNRDPAGPYAQGTPQAIASDAANFLREVTGDDGGLTVYPSLDDNNRVGVGSDGGIYLPIVDSDCISIEGSGTEADPYRMEPIISNDCEGGNFLSCNEPTDPNDPESGGLCVPLSTDPNNIVTFGGDGGIFAPPTPSPVEVGCGLEGTGQPANPLLVRLDPDPSNAIVCGTGPSNDGLYVSPAAVAVGCGLVINADDEIEVAVSGTDFGTIGDGGCDFADGSLIVCGPDGTIRGEPPYQQSQGFDGGADFPMGYTLAPGEVICGPIITHVVTNPSNCRTLNIHLQTGMNYAGAGQDANIEMFEERDIGTPPPGVLTPSPAFHQSGALPNNATVNHSMERDFFNITIPPGQTYTFRQRVCLRNIGTGTFVSNNPLGSSIRHWGGTA